MLISDIPQTELKPPYNVPLLPISLNRYDLIRDKEDTETLRHWHEDTQMIMVESGRIHIHMQGANLLLQEGDFLLITSRKKHTLLPKDSESCMVTVLIADLITLLGNHSLPDRISGPLFMEMNRDYLYIPEKDPSNRRIRDIMRRLLEVENDKPASGSLEILGLMYQMLAVILSYHEESPSLGKEKTQEEDSINRMLSYIARFYMNDISLENIARAGHVCRSRCCNLFKSYLGLSPIRFLNSYRLSISKDLLLSSNQKIVDIATQCGFQNESYFIRLFSEKYGSTPRLFRLKRQNGMAPLPF